MSRTFVPFDSLWQMRIDVPYSLLVRVGDHGWSCGQLALDSNADVIAADDLVAQSGVVAGYVSEVVGRSGLSAEHLKRLVLYYVPADGDDHGNVESMRAAFRSLLGDKVLLDVVPIPHFYYDGIVLEVDAFAGPVSGDCFDWVSVETPVDEFDMALAELSPEKILSAHWVVPEQHLGPVAASLKTHGLIHDAGAVVSAGPATDVVRGTLVQMVDRPICVAANEINSVLVTSRTTNGLGWIGARCNDASLGLVAQTERIMDAIASTLADSGAGFDAVVKSTTLYVGGSSEADLHENMSVRNRRYAAPGPASTGLPVFGFADARSVLTVDVTLVTDESLL